MSHCMKELEHQLMLEILISFAQVAAENDAMVCLYVAFHFIWIL